MKPEITIDANLKDIRVGVERNMVLTGKVRKDRFGKKSFEYVCNCRNKSWIQKNKFYTQKSCSKCKGKKKPKIYKTDARSRNERFVNPPPSNRIKVKKIKMSELLNQPGVRKIVFTENGFKRVVPNAKIPDYSDFVTVEQINEFMKKIYLENKSLKKEKALIVDKKFPSLRGKRKFNKKLRKTVEKS